MGNADTLDWLSIELSKSHLPIQDNYDVICQCILKVVPTANSVSLWHFDVAKTSIQCVALQINSEFQQPINVILHQPDFPEYFDAITSESFVCASDAMSDSATKCFRNNYLKDSNVVSILDFVFNQDFMPFGIICCERTVNKTVWSESDKQALKRVATIISVYS